MEYNKSWSPEEDEKLTQLKAEGKSAKEISAIIGRSFSATNKRWSDLQKAKKKTDEPAPAAVPAKQEGELNDLEKVMAEQIKELTADKERLAAEVEGLVKDLEKAISDNSALDEKVNILTDALAQRDAELTDVKALLALNEEKQDADREEARKSAEEALTDAITAQAEAIEHYNELVNEKDKKIDQAKAALCKRDAKIDALQRELTHTYRTALKFAEKCLLNHDTEEIPQI